MAESRGDRAGALTATINTRNQKVARLIEYALDVVVAPLMTFPAGEILSFMAHDHPAVRRLLVVRQHDTMAAMRSLRSGLADACLLEPMRRSRIRRVLGDGPRNWRG